MLPSQNITNQTLNISEMEAGDDECWAASCLILHESCGWPEEGGRWQRNESSSPNNKHQCECWDCAPHLTSPQEEALSGETNKTQSMFI